jgi:hypothetical protein
MEYPKMIGPNTIESLLDGETVETVEKVGRGFRCIPSRVVGKIVSRSPIGFNDARGQAVCALIEYSYQNIATVSKMENTITMNGLRRGAVRNSKKGPETSIHNALELHATLTWLRNENQKLQKEKQDILLQSEGQLESIESLEKQLQDVKSLAQARRTEFQEEVERQKASVYSIFEDLSSSRDKVHHLQAELVTLELVFVSLLQFSEDILLQSEGQLESIESLEKQLQDKTGHKKDRQYK